MRKIYSAIRRLVSGINITKNISKPLAIAFFVLLALAFSQQSFSQTNTWDGSGGANWSTTSSWSLNHIPLATEDVVIPNNFAVTMNTAAAVCKTLTISSGNQSTTLTFSGTNSLTVSGAVSIGAGTGSGDNKTIAVGGGVFSAASVSVTATGSNTRSSGISLSTGTVNISGNITMGSTDDDFTFTGNGTLNIGGNFTGGTFTPNTGTVNCYGATAQTFGSSSPYSFYNFTVNKSVTANTVTSNGNAFQVANNLTVTTGNLILQATDNSYNITNDLTVGANGVLTHSVNWDLNPGKELNVNGNIAIDGIFNYTVRSHVHMDGAGNKTVRTGNLAGSAFSIFTLGNGNFSANGTVKINDNFWAMFNAPGSFHTNNQSVTANAAVLISGGTVYVDGGTLNVTGGISVSAGQAGTLNFSAGIVNTDGVTVGTATTGTFTHSGGTANINGALTIFSTGTYTCTASPVINIKGDWTNNGTFTPSTSLANFNGSAGQTITGATTFGNLTIADAAGITLANNITVNNNLTLSSGLVTTGANVVTIAAAGNIPTYSASSYVNGKLARLYNAVGSKIFPVGKGGNYRPLTFAYTSLTGTSTVTAEQFESALTGTLPANTLLYAARYWDITQSGGSAINYKVTLDATGFAPGGAVKILKKESGSITANPSTTPNYTNTTGFTTLTGINSFALGYDCSLIAPTGTNNSRCGTGTVTITATPAGGETIDWYDLATGGTLLLSGNTSFTTPSISAATTYYAQSRNTTTGCLSATRTAVVATVNAFPAAPVSADASLCGPGTVSISATPGAGETIDWYAAAAGGSALATGTNTFTTPSISATTIYYAESRNTVTGCISATRKAVSATIINPVVISSQPSPVTQTICATFPASFTVSATGDVTGYQWYLGAAVLSDNANISGSQTATLNIDQVSISDAGLYHVVVKGTAPCADVTSSDATLIVNQDITINTQPSTQAICVGGTATFTIVATGTGLTYQWKKNGANLSDGGNISGALTASLSIANVTAADVASYSVVASDGVSGCPNVNSVNAALTVNPLPTITPAASAAAVCFNPAAQNTSLTYSSTNTPTTYSITWSAAPANSFVAVTDAALPASPVTISIPAGTAPGTYTGTITVKNANGCVSSAGANFTVTVNDLPTITPAATAADVCFKATAQTTSLAYSATTNTPTTYSITWSAAPANSFAAVTNAALPASPITINVPAGTAPGTYIGTITVKNANGCISSTGTPFTVTVNPLPTITPSATAAAVCFSAGAQTSQLTYGGTTNTPTTYSITWSAAPANSFAAVTDAALPASPVTINVPAGTAANTYTGTITVKNANGCVSSASSFTIKVNPLPTITPAASAAAVCFNPAAQNTSLTYSSTNTPTTYSITWSAAPANSFVAVTDAALPASPVTISIPAGTAPGTYTGTITVKNANGCVSSAGANFTVTVNDLPTITPAATAADVCFKATAQTTSLAYSATTNTPTTYSITWSAAPANSFAAVTNAALPASPITINVPAGTAPGTYIGTITVKNANGCISSTGTPFTVTVNPLPTITPSATAAAVCFSAGAQTSQLTYGGTTNTPTTYSITWSAAPANSFAAVTDAALPASPVTINVPAGTAANTYTGTITVKNANGCVSSASSFTIKVNPLPTITPAASAAAVCFNPAAQNTSLTYSSTNTPTTYSITWSAAPANSFVAVTDAALPASPVTISIPAGTAPGTYTGTITVKNANGCVSSAGANFTVTVNDLPTITPAATAADVCFKATAQTTSLAYSATTNTPTTYSITWSAAPANSFAAVTNAALPASPITINVPAGTAPGTYTGTITVKNANGCISSTGTPFTVTINSLPTAAAITSDPQNVCVGGTLQLVPAGSGVGTLSYTWTSGTPAVASINAVGLVSGISVGSTGYETVNFTYKVTDANGCTSATSAPYTIAVSKPIANAITQASGQASLCMGSTLALTQNAIGAAALTYTWASSNNTKATVDNNGIVTAIAATSPTINISYTVTDSYGCTTTSAPYAITVVQIPVGSLASTATAVCAGSGITFTAPAGYASYTFYVNGTKVQGPNTTNTFSTSALTNGASVTVDVANSLNCGATFGPVVITVNPLPVATLAADKAAICPGDLVTFTAGALAVGNTYNFKLNGSSVQSGSSNIYSTATFIAGNNPVTVDVTNSNGCTATSAPVSVMVNAVPSGTLTATAATICAGDNVTFTATSGFASYEFFVNGVSQGIGGNTFSTTSLTNPSVVTVSVTNGSGCVATFGPKVVTVNPLPTGSIVTAENSGIANDYNICGGSSVTFTATAGLTNYKFYLRNTATLLQGGASNIYTSTTLITGDYVTVVVTNSNGCASTLPQSATITVVASPAGKLTVSNNPICAGDNVTFTATSDPSFTNYLFKLNGTTALQTGSGNTFSTTSLAMGDVVTVDVTNSNGCITTFNAVTMTVNPLPSGTLVPVENSGSGPANDGFICSGATVAFTAPAGFANYNFLLNGVSVQNSAVNMYVNSALADQDKVTVAVTNATGCIGLLNTVIITVNPLPVLAAINDGAPAVCVNSLTPAFTNAQAGGIWSVTNGTGSASITSGGVVKGLTPGTVIINYTYTNPNGCTSTINTSIIVNPLPVVVAITGNVNICTGTATQFNDATPNGVWSSVNPLVASVDPSGMVTGEGVGNTSIRYTVTDPTTGCATTVGINVTVNSAPIISDITPGAADICTGGTVTLGDLTPGGVWSSADDAIATVSTSGVVTGVTGGTVTISYTVTTTCGAPFIKTAIITVHDLPAAVTTGGGGTFCGNTAITADNGADGTIYFQGTVSNGTSAATPSASQIVSASGTYYFRAQSASGCWGPQGSVVVTINPVPAITTVSGGGTFCGSTAITAAGGAGGTIYFQGSTSGGTSTLLGGSPQTISASGTYYFRAKSAAGCWGPEASVSVTINPLPAITTVSGGGTFCGTTAITAFGGAGGTIYFQGTTSGGTSTALGGTPQTITASGTYYFRAQSAAGCWGAQGSVTVTINPLPTATISGTVSVCKNATAPTITFTGANGTAPYIFTYHINTGGNLTVTSVGNIATVTAPTGTVGTFTYTLISVQDAESCSQLQSGSAVVTVNDLPTISLLGYSSAVCQSDIVSLTATSTGSPVTQTAIFSSAADLDLDIPDAHGFFSTPGEANTSLSITGIPAGAYISDIKINLNVTHTYDGDLNFNLKAPGGNNLNLVNRDGGAGQNFTNTIISMGAASAIPNTGAPYSGTYKPDGANITVGGSNANISNFSPISTGTINGTWTLYAEDAGKGDVGQINNWSVTIEYQVPSSNPVTWSPITDLYSDGSANTPYVGQSLTTVFFKPSTGGVKTYIATATNVAGCTKTAQATITVGTTPVITITPNYCLIPGKVLLTASPSAGVTFKWATGQVTDTVQVDEAGDYSVTGTNSQGCKGYATISVSKELVTNGDFESGDGVGFTTAYTPRTGSFYNGLATSGLYPEGDYAVDVSAFSPSNGVGYHPSFHGKDHTTGSGKYMMVNGSVALRTIWQETVTVLPNTTYYFSAWGMNLNPGVPAQLQFAVNGDPAGGIGDLNLAPKPTTEGQVNLSNWIRFYGTWTSGPATTTAVINIVNLNTVAGGNDFGLDDISFATLSTFIDLISAPGTDAQSVCVNTPLVNIVYRAGNGNPSGPNVTGLPAGITSTFIGDKLTFSGTPTVPGNYTYTITTTGCAPYSVTGTISVQAQKIVLASGSASPSVCVNNSVSIGFTLSGTATGATVTGLPATITGTISGAGPYTYTLSGTPTVAGVYPYTITTTGTCAPVTATGTITVTAQTITLNSANDVQAVCINAPIANIQYTIGGTGTGASISGLPAGVSFSYNSGILFINGTPTVAGTFTYTITSSGTCTPVTASGTITVTPAASLALTSANNVQTVCNNTAIAAINYTISNGTGAIVTGLPAGVTLTVAGNTATISGTATAAGIFNYTISTTGGCGTGTKTGTITVQTETISLTSGASSPTVCINAPIIPVVYTIGGTATGASISGQPAGVTGVLTGNTFTISGTPSVAGPFTYTVTLTGSCAATVTAIGTITVQPAAVGGSLTSVSACSGVGGTLTVLGQVGTIVRWEYSDDNGGTWVAIVNTGISQAYPGLTAARMYRVVVGNGCGNVFSSVATVGIHNLWTGTVSTDWNTAGNWSDNLVPSVSCPTVTIPQVPANRYPILSTGAMATIINLDIRANASVTISGNTIQIKGSITNAGAFDVTAGTLELNGAAAQTIDGNTFVAHTIQNLTISNNVTVNVTGLNDTLKISGQLGFGVVSSKTFNAGSNNVTLLSTVNGTASVGQILNSNVISGTNFTVERYIATGTGSAPNHGKSWQLLATPTQGQTIKASWQEGATATNISSPAPFSGGNPHPGYGTMLTSAVAGAASQPTPGFDAFTAPGPSIKTYNYLTNGYDNGPASTANQLYNKKGYIILVRGDRSVYTSNGAATPTILRSTGTLFTPANLPPATNVVAANFESVGNPYAAPLDLRKIKKTGGVDEFYYVWDPRLGGTSNLGAYQTLFKSGSDYYAIPGGGTYGAGINNFIQSGQAFLVQATGSNGTVSFDETAKATGSAMLFTPNQPAQFNRFLRTSLNIVGSDGSTSMADGVIDFFGDSYSNAIDGLDARKNGNTGENLSIKTAGKLLAIERKHTITQNDTIFLNLTGTRLLNYRFEFTATDLDKPTLDGNGGNLQGFVEDTYLHTSTPLNLSGTTLVNFTIVNIPASYAPDRFRIVFAPVKVLPVTFTSVKAYRQAASINVEWKVSNEFNIKQYEVEKSGNGMSFTTLAVKAPVNNQGAAASYYTADSKPADGYNYYRIRSVDVDGKVQYTSVVKVFMGGGKPEIVIYPNPITNGIINLHLTNLPAGEYGIRLLNKLGQVIVSKQVTHAEGSSIEPIKWDYNLAHGMYTLEVTNPDGTKKNLNVMY